MIVGTWRAVSAKTGTTIQKIADNLQKIEKKRNFRRLSAFFQENILDGTLCDLIIDRADNTINLCEVKYSEELYSLDKEEYLKIQHRIKAFKDVTATKSSIIPTMITTFGKKVCIATKSLPKLIWKHYSINNRHQ